MAKRAGAHFALVKRIRWGVVVSGAFFLFALSHHGAHLLTSWSGRSTAELAALNQTEIAAVKARELLARPWDLDEGDPQYQRPVAPRSYVPVGAVLVDGTEVGHDNAATLGSAGAPGSAAFNATEEQAASNHTLAVLVPYRDREPHLKHLLEVLPTMLEAQGTKHDVFVIEQADGYLFNRGALLNAAVQLLASSDYDYYVFQDVDTVPKPEGGIRYDYPKGGKPTHLTPYWIHPKATYEDFFGGLLIITREQYFLVDGYGTDFWGWGREDDNFRERLRSASLWPCTLPDVPKVARRDVYFEHQKHQQATELRGKETKDGGIEYFEADPGRPYEGAKIMSSQPELLQDRSTGISTVKFRIESISPWMGTTRIKLRLHCNLSRTPFCDPNRTVKNHAKGGMGRLSARKIARKGAAASRASSRATAERGADPTAPAQARAIIAQEKKS